MRSADKTRPTSRLRFVTGVRFDTKDPFQWLTIHSIWDLFDVGVLDSVLEEEINLTAFGLGEGFLIVLRYLLHVVTFLVAVR